MEERVLGVLAGCDMPPDQLRRWADSATHLYAADSGADQLLAIGHRPVLVGDLDSFTHHEELDRLRVEHIPEQDHTDGDKMLQVIQADGHRTVTLAGMEGDLMDHTLAAFGSAIGCGLAVRFAFRRGVGVLLRAGEAARLAVVPGRRVSLLPLLPCQGVDFRGVKWPLAGAEMQLGGLVSISNSGIAETVEASIAQGAALLFAEFEPEEMPRW